jgi:hypothetical protein
MPKPEHFLLLAWMILTGLIVFAAAVSIDRGLVQAMLAMDQSKICMVIIMMYGLGLGHSFQRTLYLSRQLNLAAVTDALLRAHPKESLQIRNGRLLTANGLELPDSFISRYITDLAGSTLLDNKAETVPGSRGDLLEAYASKIRAPQEFGWFLIDLMLKVGFLGTLIGFILMLGSVSQNATLDASMMQQVIKQMSQGMSTALYTTLASIVGALLLAIPYHWLDRGLAELLESAVYLTEVQALPRLTLANQAPVTWPYKSAAVPDTGSLSTP